MMSLRVAAVVAIATGLATMGGEAAAQYYPPGPYGQGVYRGPPGPVPPAPIEIEDAPDIYAPPPPPNYGRRYGDAPYPAEPQPATDQSVSDETAAGARR